MKKCNQCGKIFYRPRGNKRISNRQWENRMFCSYSCLGNNKKGKPLNEATKLKLSIAHKNIKNHSGRFMVGHKINLGRKQSDALITKKRELFLNKHRPELSGNKNPRWIDGRTPENERIRKSIELRLWREGVFVRDNWTCQNCGQYGVQVNAHHIKNFAQAIELRTSIGNGITFCKTCHKIFHKQFGIKNNNKEQVNDFKKITDKIIKKRGQKWYNFLKEKAEHCPSSFENIKYYEEIINNLQ